MRYINKIALTAYFLICLFCHSAHSSSLSDDMDKFYDSLGGTSNVTNPQFIQGQKAGYLSLGGLQYRSNSQNAQLASMQLPSLRAGCGGIDFFAGGMSFINSDQLLALIKSIGSSSSGLLLQMAIDQVSPQLGSVIKYMNNLARQINDLNINSCDAAKTLLQSPGTIMQTAKTQACKIGGTISNQFTDAADANSKCNSGGSATSTANSAPNVIKDQFPVGNTNIAWKALKDSGFMDTSSSGGLELAQMMMTLSGTIVIKDASDDNGQPSIDSFFPAMKDENLINTLLEGGTYQGLQCDETDKCLNISTSSNAINITSEKSYLGKVSSAIAKIQDAIRSDDPSKMDGNAYKLLSFSSLPLYKMLNVQTAYYPDSTEINSISEYIALDILYGYLEKENEIVRRAAAKYDKKGYHEVFESWFDAQKEIKAELNARRQKLSAQFKDYYEMLNRTATIEKMFSKDVTTKVGFGGRR
jgi:conjugative transfer pilus assembly protein TraH